MFRKRLLIVGDGQWKVTKLFIRGADASESPEMKSAEWGLNTRSPHGAYFAIILKSVRTSRPSSIAILQVSIAPS